MISVQQALVAILREVKPPAPSSVPLADAYGLVLAEETISDVDSPSFDKALMDGYAVRSADLTDGRATLKIIEEVTAGRVPTRSVGAGEATRIMTGAPIPPGADAVVRVEDTQFNATANRVSISTKGVEPGTSILRRGTSLRRGERVLPAGRLLRPQELGALAELGIALVPARTRPRVAVLATGDELVPVEQPPGPGQIRNSNETMLVAQVRRAGGEPVPLGIARDDRDHLRAKIAAGLDCDVLLLSGGVSEGKLDLVPSELEAAGVRPVFHKTEMKPGKPVWFGVRSETPCYVFGLPGNPVSSMVCFELFARTAIRRLLGVEPAAPQPVKARLKQDHVAKGDRPTYHPSHLEWTESGPLVTPLRWHGSSDLRATVEANAMAFFPAGDATYPAGQIIDVFFWD